MDRSNLPTGPPSPFRLFLSVIFVAALSGCAMHPEPVKQPVRPARTPAPASAPKPRDPAAAKPRAWVVESEWTPEEKEAVARENQARTEPGARGQEPSEETPEALEPGPEEEAAEAAVEVEEGEVQAGEPVTESPLDELAGVEPKLSPEEAEKSRDLVEDAVPTFDIPMVTNDRVLAWVERYTHQYRTPFEAGLARSGKYMEMFRRIFAEEGVPQDMVYMAAVESGFKTTAYSRAKARGIFQFMTATGRLYGLRVDSWVDERSDPEKSCRAAARYMKRLHNEFGDWYLALAAYNAGEGKIRRAIARSGARDFWGIAATKHIRTETKNHVPAVLAAAILSKSPAKYGLDYVPEPRLTYETIEVDGAADLQVLARCAGTDVETLRQLNPALRRHQTPPGSRTHLRVPVGTGDHTTLALSAIPAHERVLFQTHKVRRGDTLSAIARRYGVDMASIQQANQMGRKTLITVNQTLRIPTSGAGPAVVAASRDVDSSKSSGPEIVTYRVRKGDTLTRIAQRHGTTPQVIAAHSGISVERTLRVGDRLRVPRGARSVSHVATPARSKGQPIQHTVKSGDTLWGIATLYETTVRVLCSLNSISTSTVLLPGAKLTVRYE